MKDWYRNISPWGDVALLIELAGALAAVGLLLLW